MAKQLRTFILDDEIDNVNELLHLLKPYHTKLVITHTATTFEEAVKILTIEKFDLSLVDFALDNGYDLIDLIKIIDKRNFGLIGLHSVRNGDFKTAAIIGDFTHLMKPFEPIGIADFINKVLTKKIFDTDNHRHPVKFKGSTLFLLEEDIYYIKSNNKICTYYCKEQAQIPKEIIVTSSLKAIEAELSEFYHLVRCHESYIINIRYFIESKKRDDAGDFTIVIKDEKITIPYSSGYKDRLIQKGAIPG